MKRRTLRRMSRESILCDRSSLYVGPFSFLLLTFEFDLDSTAEQSINAGKKWKGFYDYILLHNSARYV
jgi:hypothetical protein